MIFVLQIILKCLLLSFHGLIIKALMETKWVTIFQNYCGKRAECACNCPRQFRADLSKFKLTVYIHVRLKM
jgi:hypothetical protein